MSPRYTSVRRAPARLAGSLRVAVMAIAVTVAALLTATPAVAAQEPTSAAASSIADTGIVKAAAVVGFNAENIISDALFYDGAAMSSAEIQAFLDAKIGTCKNGKCLNVLQTGISSRAAVVSQTTGNLICSAIQGGSMLVSELIYRVQVACGVSAKVILVTLQKEQGLTTSNAPSDWNLTAAMGASCPDTAPCDPAFAGVGPQILKGTQQLKTYKAAKFGKQPGVNYIGYSPTASCGGTNLNIQNYATAALYSYTPYQPNAAALAAGYGLGDGCSSYGNRNFYNYYTNWFGSTQGLPASVAAASTAIAKRWSELGGASGSLGASTSSVACGTARGGCYQNFANGAISWTASTGAWETSGGIRERWKSLGYEAGILGYPIGALTCGMSADGCYQNFEAGAISWTASTGAWETYGDIRSRWQALGFEMGVLAYPVDAPSCGTVGAGCYQNFQGGAISWTASTGAWETYGDIRAYWKSSGYETGPLGYPTGAVVTSSTGTSQTYQGGTVVATAAAGAFVLSGAIAARWTYLGGLSATVGAPTSAMACTTSGCTQAFAAGTISWASQTGAWETYGSIGSRWKGLGAETGVLGYPSGAPVCVAVNGGCYQNFENGAISWTASTGAWETYGDIRSYWQSTGFEKGSLGYPTSAVSTVDGVVAQTFQGGSVVIDRARGTTVTIGGAMGARWLALGGLSSVLGAPTGAQTCGTVRGGCYQNFVNGAISWTASTGAWETYGALRAYWKSTGFENGQLGYPTAAPVAAGGVFAQDFQGASLVVNAAGGSAFTIGGEIGARWRALGGLSSPVGAPIGSQTCGTVRGGCYQNFANGAISWTASTRAWETFGDIRAYWKSTGFESGPLGYPTGAVVTTSTGASQKYEGGTVTSAGGAVSVAR